MGCRGKAGHRPVDRSAVNCARVWVDGPADPQTRRDRRKAMNRALDELNNIGRKVSRTTTDTRTLLTIRRPTTSKVKDQETAGVVASVGAEASTAA